MQEKASDVALHALHLCSGYGGFELALRIAGVDVRTVAHVEREAFAAATLVARMDEALLDRAPIWDDLCTFDGRLWRGRVDLITAGFPCPDFSAAGRRAGVDGEHWLWPEVSRVIRDVGPRFVVLENVPGLVRLGGLTRVLSDLAAFGFDAEWGLLSASAVGAPHERSRFWLVAYADVDGLQSLRGKPRDYGHARNDTDGRGGADVAFSTGIEREPAGHQRPVGLLDDARGRVADVGDARGEGRSEVTRSAHGDEGQDGWRPSGGDVAHGAGEDVVDASCVDEREPHREAGAVAWGESRTDAGGRCFPPLRDDVDGWRDWIAGGGPEPQVRRSSDGRPLELADALHLGGNGLVPLAAAHALRVLSRRAFVSAGGSLLGSTEPRGGAS